MLNNRIKILRKLKGYTQKEMAAFLHKSQSAYSRMESSGMTITTEELKDIAGVLDCKVEDLLKEQGIIDMLRHKDKAAAEDDNGQINSAKEFGDQYKELLDMVLEHQQQTLTEIKAFIKESHTQMTQLAKALVTGIKA